MIPIRFSTTNFPKTKAIHEKSQVPCAFCFTPIVNDNVYNLKLEPCPKCGSYPIPPQILTNDSNVPVYTNKCEFCGEMITTQSKYQIPNISEWEIESETTPRTAFLIDSSISSRNNNFYDIVLQVIQNSFPKTTKNVGFFTITDQLSYLLPNSQIGVIPDLEDAVLPKSSFLDKFPDSIEPLLKVHQNDKGPDVISALDILSKSIGPSGHIYLFLCYPPEGKVTFSRVSVETENDSLRGPNYSNQIEIITKRIDQQNGYLDVYVHSLAARLIDCATFGKMCSFLGGRIEYSNSTSNWSLYQHLQMFLDSCDTVCSLQASGGVKILPSLGEHQHHPHSFKLTSPQSQIFPIVLPENFTTKTFTIQSVVKYRQKDGIYRQRVYSYTANVTENEADVFKGADCGVVFKYIVSTMLCIFFNNGGTLRNMESLALGLLKPIFFTYRYHISRNPNRFANLVMPKTLQMLPRLVLGILKSTAFNPGISFDERSAQMVQMGQKYPDELIKIGYPKIYEMTKYLQNVPNINSNDDLYNYLVPVNLNEYEMKENRFLLLHDGFNTFLWFGEKFDNQLCKATFGFPSAYTLNEIHLIDTNESRALYSLIKGNVRFFYAARSGYQLFTDRLIEDFYPAWLEKVHSISLPKNEH